MYLRRLRTLMDQLLQPPDTPPNELMFEARLDELVAQMAPDVALDYAKWADPWSWGEDLSMSEAMDQLKKEYLAARRVHLYQTHSVDNLEGGDDIAGIPQAQVGIPRIDIDSAQFDVNPAGSQDEEYLKLNNANLVAVDISGWQLRGGIQHTFRPGTVIPEGSALYVTPNVVAFRNRQTDPSAGQGLLVQGNYSGHISNFGETIELVAPNGSVVSSLTTPSIPSHAQQYVRVTELHYNPPGEDHTEFIELTNTSRGDDAVSIDLGGASITEGPNAPFLFPQGTTIAPGQHLLVANDPAALLAADPGIPAESIVGQFSGRLNNAGEQIKLEDATGSTILDFRYQDDWFPQTDGEGHSLVVTNTAGDYNDRANWRASVRPGGSPGTTESLTAEPGDSNQDGQFDQADIIQVLWAGKYLTGLSAMWSEGDWDGDGLFGPQDIDEALQTGNYLQGPYVAHR
jgi:hypothetical protein